MILCERHHVALHDGEFRIVALGAGRFRFDRPDGPDLEEPFESDRLDDLTQYEIAPGAAKPFWDGQRLDRPYAISVLAQQRYNTEARVMSG